MSDSFFERNKRKGAAAAYWPALLRGRAALALLLLGGLAGAFLLGAGESRLLGLPGGERLAAAAGWMSGRLGLRPKRSFNELISEFRAARGKAEKAPAAAPRAAGAGDPEGAGSVGFVLAGRGELDAKARAYDDKLGRPGSVKGIVDEGAGETSADGVALKPEDVAAGGGGAAALASKPYPHANLFGAAGRAVVVSVREQIRALGRAALLGVVRDEELAGGVSSLGQLAEANGLGQLATARCRDAACTGELSSELAKGTWSGSDLSHALKSVALEPQAGLASRGAPSGADGGLAALEAEADRTRRDQELCRRSDETYGAQEKQLVARQDELYRRASDLGCDGSRWTDAKSRACDGFGAKIRELCLQASQVRCTRVRACPLTAGQSCEPQSSCPGSQI